MRYLIKREPSLHGAFAFFNESGDLIYRAGAPTLSLGYTLTLHDAEGKAVLAIDEEKSHPNYVFAIRRDTVPLARVIWEGLLLRSYRIETADGQQISVQPNLWRTSFDFLGQDGKVAILQRPFLERPPNFSERIKLTIFDERHALTVIAANVAILNVLPEETWPLFLAYIPRERRERKRKTGLSG